MPEDYSEQFERGVVLQVISEDETGQLLLIQRTDSSTMEIQNSYTRLTKNDQIVLQETHVGDDVNVSILEPYRLDGLLWLTIIFLGIAIVIGGKRGLSSVIGLFVSLGLVAYWILPTLATSAHTLAITLGGAVLLSVITMTIAHGINRKTAVALASTLLTLGLAFFVGHFAINGLHLLGMGSEYSVDLMFGNFPQLNMQGLLLGAILISTVGILDDITIGQTAIIDELHHTNPNLKPRELFRKSLNVGREHIASLVNTLVIVYMGTALPLFLLIVDSKNPLWVILNNESIAEELVRTLVGSMALMLAVPISSFLAAGRYKKFAKKR